MNDSNLQAAQEAFAAALIPISLLAVVLFVGFVLVTGYSMKFALAVAGVGRFGFWKSIGIVIATTLSSTFVSMSILFAMPGEPVAGLIACVASLGTYVLIISAFGRCSIGSGVKTYFLNGIFSFLGTIPLMAILIAGVMIISATCNLNGPNFEKVKSYLANSQGSVAGDSSDSEFENFVIAANGFDITSVKHAGGDSGDADANTASSIPKQLPSLMSAEPGGLFNQFFTDEKTSPYPTPVPRQCQSGCPQNRPSPPKKVNPISSGIQANPFAN